MRVSNFNYKKLWLIKISIFFEYNYNLKTLCLNKNKSVMINLIY